MTDEWQQEIAGRMKKLRLSLETLRVQRKVVPELEKKKVDALTKEAEDLLKAVGEDKSEGVHNFAYAQKLVGEAEEKVLSVKRRLSK
jgi:phage shock protein A